jgi:hypothetical protein
MSPSRSQESIIFVNSMRSVIYINKDGGIVGLADDIIDGLKLGEKTVERVSNVEFDHTQQLWVATDLFGSVIASDPVRSRVIDLEREYFNSMIEASFAQ